MHHQKKKFIYKYLIALLLLIIYFLASYNNVGFYKDDEHFQILEPVAYLLGLNNVLLDDKLGFYWEWESANRVRPWLQPNIYYLLIILLKFFHLNDPFIWVFVIRIFNSILGIASILYLYKSLKTYFFKEDKFYIYLIYFLFWFFPFLHIRTSSESLSLILFCFSFAYLINLFDKKEIEKNIINIIFFGFILGLSVVVRPQIIFTIFPICIWILTFKYNLKKIFFVSLGFILAIFLGLYIDYINWGFFTNTYFQIYKIQIVYGRMGAFGSEPWWYYIVTILKDLAPVFSLIFLISLMYFFYKNPRSIFTIMIIGTFLILSFFEHKETRFIFPIYIFAPFFLIYFFENIRNIKVKYFLINLALFFNLIFLFIVIFFPINGKVSLYKFLFYQEFKYENIFYYGENPYQFNGMEPFFYTKFLPKLTPGNEMEFLDDALVVTNDYDIHKKLENKKKCKVVYSTYPITFIELNDIWKKRKVNWYVNKCSNIK